MAVKFYNTLSGKKELFKPIKDKKVGLYTCGPTVYDFAHIGNLRTYIFEDILRRVLEYNGYDVTHVMNITDVGHLTSDADTGEDKIEKAAKEQKKNALEIADFYANQFRVDIADLNILRPHMMPRATEHIKEQIELIGILEKKGFTYKISDGIYFDTSKFKDYGKLGKINIKGLKQGARIKKIEEKKNQTDFALWKFSPRDKKRQMEWDSPWGIGFPGWHIECSAMSVKYLDQPFDIHTGGIDHIPIHHQNEIAQLEAAYDKPLANYWLHGEFLAIDKKKMAKSEGSFITLRDIEKKGFSPLVYRFLVLSAHYRTPLSFSWKSMETAKYSLEHLYNEVQRITLVGKKNDLGAVNEKYKDKFLEKINDDLNIPQALAVVQDLLKSNLSNNDRLTTLLDFDKVLGLKISDVLKPIEIPSEIKELAERRTKARRLNNWADADALREEIRRLGFDIEDTEEGYILRKK